ncbi:hypothetical protein M3Y97_00468300 [Aphelenchoides bicaudatus]|nr:hypothetical protein M3Y97_00468300 [Aphelenchoides bicaudatus]
MLNLKLLFVAVLVAGFASASETFNLTDFGCLGKSLQLKFDDPGPTKALKLETAYKMVVRYTDLLTDNTAKIVESNFTDALVVRKEQKGVDETFFVKNNTVHYKSDGSCSVVEQKEINSVYNATERIRNLFKNPAANMADFLYGLGNTKFNTQKLSPNFTNIDGSKTVEWTGCINQTKDDYAVEFVVNYVPEKSQPSYSDYNNPRVASIKMIVFKVDNWTNPTRIEHVEEYTSLSIVELEHTRSENKQKATTVPRGVYCQNMTKSKLPAKLKLPKRFQANIEYVDTEKRSTDTVDLTYDEQNRIVSFALDFDNDADIPYVQNKDSTKVKGKARIIQDFKSGFEYSLSRDGRVCNKVGSIQSTWADVTDLNGTLILRDPTTVFFNISQRQVYFAGQVVEEGVTYDSYVSKKFVDSTAKDYIVVEMLFTSTDWTNENGQKDQNIHSIVQYHKNANNTLVKKTVIRFNSLQDKTTTGISWAEHGVQTCMLDGPPIDNFFFLKLADVKMADIQTYGYENVDNALSEALANTTNISVLRVSQFLFKTVEGELLACFLLGEKNNATPAKTKSLINEKTIQEVRQQLNETLKTQKIVVTVPTEDAKTVKLSVTALGMVSTKEHVQPIPYYGYSGGSMFILAIFMFIFGAGGTVGIYLLYMKRQAVRGIAYQVFE